MVIYEWWAAAINLVLLVFLGLSAPWWLRTTWTERYGVVAARKDSPLVLALSDRCHGADGFLGDAAFASKLMGR